MYLLGDVLYVVSSTLYTSYVTSNTRTTLYTLYTSYEGGSLLLDLFLLSFLVEFDDTLGSLFCFLPKKIYFMTVGRCIIFV